MLSIKNEQGYTLISVLLVVLLLTILGGAYFFAMNFEVHQSFRHDDRIQAYYFARSGAEAGFFWLENEGYLDGIQELDKDNTYFEGSLQQFSFKEEFSGEEPIEVIIMRDENQIRIEATGRIREKNIQENHIKNCTVVPYALGNSNEDIDIFINDNNLGGASVTKKEKAERIEKIKQTTLDDFVRENHIKRIDFIKADIEGAERFMLLGAEKVIKKFKPKIAICTYHLPDDPEILENILKSIVPEYNIVHKYKKMYAWVEK